jgi:hypothetical protein
MLIMASMNHTAPARPLVRKEPHRESTSRVGDPPHLAEVRQERRHGDKPQQISTALAVAEIEGMLKTDHAFQQARLEGKRTRILPLNPVQYMVLEATLDLLRQHVDTLKSEASG